MTSEMGTGVASISWSTCSESSGPEGMGISWLLRPANEQWIKKEEGTVENVADGSEVGIVAVENQLVGVHAVQSAVSTSNSNRRATSR